MGVLEVRCAMKNKQNVIEIIFYVLVILFLIFGVKSLKTDNAEKKEVTIPTVETPVQTGIDMNRVQ